MLTTRKLYAEWRRINERVFSGTLKPCKISFRPTTQEELDDVCEDAVQGICMVDGKRVHIQIDSERCLTPAEAFEVLAHEMVHQYQDQCGLEMQHDASFYAWKRPIRDLTGYSI